MSHTTCAIEDCGRLAKRRGYCWTHYRRARGKSRVPLAAAVRPWGRKPWHLLTDAALRYADVAAEASKAEFKRAQTALRMARIRSARRR